MISLLKREIQSKIKLIAYTDNPILGSIYFNISIFKDMIGDKKAVILLNKSDLTTVLSKDMIKSIREI